MAEKGGATLPNPTQSKKYLWWKGIPGEEHVTKLDAENYDVAMSETDKPALVMFYAPWCRFSINARRDFAAAAEQMSQEGIHVMLAAIDGDKASEIRERYREVTGYPSFIYIVKGAPRVAYQSQRSKDGFCKWLRMLQRPQQTVDTPAS